MISLRRCSHGGWEGVGKVAGSVLSGGLLRNAQLPLSGVGGVRFRGVCGGGAVGWVRRWEGREGWRAVMARLRALVRAVVMGKLEVLASWARLFQTRIMSKWYLEVCGSVAPCVHEASCERG